MHFNVSIYFILELCHKLHQIFIRSTGIIFVTELGLVVVQVGRVYIKAWSMQIDFKKMILAGNAWFILLPYLTKRHKLKYSFYNQEFC